MISRVLSVKITSLTVKLYRGVSISVFALGALRMD